MDYASLQEVIDSGTVNMTVIRNNSANDDGTDTVAGVDWFRFNNVVCTNIYVSGNCFVGFGSNAEHLRINRRDNKMYYLYREEGTVSGYARFLRIKWIGYAPYSSTSEASKMEFDVFITDDGSITLHVTKFSSTNSGTYSLTVGSKTYNYALAEGNQNVTFHYEPDGNYTVIYELPVFFAKKYLIRVGNEVFTKSENGLENIGEVEITSMLFMESGFDEIPISEDLIGLDSPEVLLWYDSDEAIPLLKAYVTAEPKDKQQIITNAIDLTDPTITGIENAVADCDGELVVAVSFDGMETWKAWDGEKWVILSEPFAGMSKQALESVTVDQWRELYQGAELMHLKVSINDSTQIIRRITINFLN